MHDVYQLDIRLTHLERSRARYRILFGLAATLALVGFVRPTPVVIRAEGFEVVDADGAVRARLSVGEGSPGLHILDPDGVARASLMDTPDGTMLYLRDGEGTTRIGVAQFSHGGGGFAIHGEDSRGATVLYRGGAGQGRLSFIDADGAVVTELREGN